MMKSLTLDQWLELLEKRHPVKIDLRLERVANVAARLECLRPAPLVITVAGTNGKGSCVAMLERLLLESGRRVGCFTSPHLLAFNERIRIQGVAADDKAICRAFSLIEAARGEISLTYFEFNTLAALILMLEAEVYVAVLEVGLGGRLDAVNIVDADVAVITSIDIDHTHWLGSERSQIALEKAGIARPARPLVCAEPEPPTVLVEHLASQGVPTLYLGEDFAVIPGLTGAQVTLRLQDAGGAQLYYREVPRPLIPLYSAVAAVQALLAVGIVPAAAGITNAFAELRLAGRFQWIRRGEKLVIIDVAHNPAAARYLHARLRELDARRILVVAAMMADKDVAGFVAALHPLAHRWYLGSLPGNSRAMDADRLAMMVYNAGGQAGTFATVVDALKAALAEARATDVIVVCGSFITAAAALAFMSPVATHDE